jgi:hypothetical protein
VTKPMPSAVSSSSSRMRCRAFDLHTGAANDLSPSLRGCPSTTTTRRRYR